MTREELITEVKKIATAYPNRVIMTQEVFDLWYETLGDLDVKVVDKVILGYIRTSHYPPTIADIRTGCKEYDDELSRITREAKNVFDDALSYFSDPDKDKKKLWHMFCEKIKQFPEEVRMQKIYEFRNKVRNTDNLPKVEDFISEFTV